VHDLQQVPDHRVAVDEEADRIEHRRRVVERAQHLVEREREPLPGAVVGGRRRNPETQHVDAADEQLHARRRALDEPTRGERLEPTLVATRVAHDARPRRERRADLLQLAVPLSARHGPGV